MSWATACNELATVYSATVGNSSSSIAFNSEGNFLLFVTTLRLPEMEMSYMNSSNDDDYVNTENVVEMDPSVLKVEISHTVKLSAIVTPHPVYSIPCPYVQKMWNESGKLYNLNECQDVIDYVRRLQSQCPSCKPTSISKGIESEWTDLQAEDNKPNTTTSSKAEAVKDNRYYEFGRLTPESHPITGHPCFSMHMCQLQDILRLSEETFEAYSTEGTDKEDQVASLYLLNWCTLVGPHFGMFISPSEYKVMAALLLTKGR